MKIIDSNSDFVGSIGGTIVFSSKNFELTTSTALYGVDAGSFGHVYYDDINTQVEGFKFRGDECDINAVEGRLSNEGMQDLLTELSNLQANAEHEAPVILVKAQKKRLKKVLGVEFAKIWQRLSTEEQVIAKIKHAIKNIDIAKEKRTKAQFRSHSPKHSGQYDPKCFIGQEVITVAWLKEELAKANEALKASLNK